MTQALISGLVVGGIYGLLALGIVLVYKGARVLNFAEAELGTFALYIAWWGVDQRGWPWPLAALLALVAVGLVSFAFERLVVARMVDASRLSVAIATLGLMLLLLAVELKVWGSGPKFLAAPFDGQAFQVAGVFITPVQVVAVLGAAAIGFGLTTFLRRTDFGLGVLAAAQDATAVRLMGVPFAKVSAFTWVAAGVLGGVAALLIEPSIGAFAPGFTLPLFVPALAAALIGGLDNLTGAFVGGVAVGLVDQLVRWQFVGSTIPGVTSLVIFGLIVAVLLLRPGGLLPAPKGRTA
jgi:branched-chain amino acid transport system permease protein